MEAESVLLLSPLLRKPQRLAWLCQIRAKEFPKRPRNVWKLRTQLARKMNIAPSRCDKIVPQTTIGQPAKRFRRHDEFGKCKPALFECVNQLLATLRLAKQRHVLQRQQLWHGSSGANQRHQMRERVRSRIFLVEPLGSARVGL